MLVFAVLAHLAEHELTAIAFDCKLAVVEPSNLRHPVQLQRPQWSALRRMLGFAFEPLDPVLAQNDLWT